MERYCTLDIANMRQEATIDVLRLTMVGVAFWPSVEKL